MGEQKNKLLKAKELFEQGKYIDSADICSELSSTFMSSADASFELNRLLFMLVAKNMLFLSTPFNIEENRQTIAESVGYATVFAETIEEYYAIEHEIFEAINKWEKEWFYKNLKYIQNNPTRDNWKKYYIDTIMPMASVKTFVSMCIANLDHVEELYDSLNMDFEEIEKKYSIPEKNELTDKEKAEAFYITCCSIFDGIKSFTESIKHSSNEYLSTVGNKIINELLLSKLVIDAGIEEAPNVLKYLHKKTEILRYMINVTVFPNGKTVKVFSNTTDEVNELKRVYNKIKSLDSSFEIPEIPAPRTAPAASVGTASGGCYVATAVYGSYDCPEVWTLRRYRDDSLANTFKGRLFIRLYYAISPTLVKYFGNTNWFKKMWKAPLDRMVARLQSEGVEATPYNDKQW